MSLNELITCPECDGLLVINQEGMTVCRNCGLVIESQSFNYDSVRAYTEDEINQKKHTEITLSHGSRTIIKKEDLNYLNPNKKMIFRKLLKLNNQYFGKERNIVRGSMIIDNTNFSQLIKKEAKRIFKKAVEAKFFKGKSIYYTALTCVYYSARVNMKLISRDIADQLNFLGEDNFLSKLQKYLSNMSKTLYEGKPLIDLKKLPQLNVNLLIRHYAEMMGLSGDLTNKVLANAKYLSGLSGGLSNSSKLAGLFYLTLKDVDESITQKEVASFFKVTEVTLRNKYKALKAYKIISELSEKQGVTERIINKTLMVINQRLNNFEVNDLNKIINIIIGSQMRRKGLRYDLDLTDREIIYTTHKYFKNYEEIIKALTKQNL